jgi:hypothetical protein
MIFKLLAFDKPYQSLRYVSSECVKCNRRLIAVLDKLWDADDICFFPIIFIFNINNTMRTVSLIIALLFTLTLVNSDLSFNSFNGDFNSLTSGNGAIPLSDLITVANYYGCKTWVKNQCTECSKGFYFSRKGVCCEVP